MPQVYLLKSPSDDSDYGRQDPYEQHIPGAIFVPILKFEPVNVEVLETVLARSNEYDGIIVTSQRAVDVLKVALDAIEHNDAIKSLPVYTVGPTTASRLRLVGFNSVYGKDTGNGGNLAREMIESIGPNQKFLFLVGEVHRDTIEKELKAKGHEIIKHVVYKTIARDYKADLEGVGEDDWIVFFSPSHTTDAVTVVKSSTRPVRVAAIGPTTQQYLIENDVAVDAVAEQPTAQGLLEAISK